MKKTTILEKICFYAGIAGLGVTALVIAPIISFIYAIPTFFLWNWLMPDLFGIKAITFFQAWGINLLACILFKSNKEDSSSRQS